ncbi:MULTISPECIES: hypothetical protein [Pseudomonas syringae group]|uniref:Uncharacterized protein n=1 Tax=Pseudomonas syringae TaxID=317 RepID=A0AAW4DVN0_PSESX|nr:MULTISPECIES: hypothetical protein [Pseudomonas syringae group]AVI86960.1 hypothetical protein XJ28_26260 [Pseudomonas syringae pv. tomato]KGK94441.1 hypothetical protein NB04_16940 [Pseudomonas syringae pv. tomato]KUR41734.1 hypothetical protein PSTA9_03793 [Pseudomonas syringae pv. tomato]KUR49424.1 hypothetical protein PST407_01896 [Pseudomonas syringae pv. tomato]MBI6697365.1 hypothetical protein [Pseudomonas syringae]
MQNWTSLRKMKAGEIIDLQGQPFLSMEDEAYKISDMQYLLANPLNNSTEGKLHLLSLFWAASEKAFRRAYYRDIEGDDMAIETPPSELLPAGSARTYRQIRETLDVDSTQKFMEHASYRLMSDGAFIHKSLESLSAVYYLRSPDRADDEMPYAILWKPSS